MSEYVKQLRQIIGNHLIVVPGVRAIIVNDDDEILLQRRADMPLWGLPGGAIELDETPRAAVRREVREETGLEISDPEPMALFSGPSQRFAYPNGDQVQGHAVAFIVRSWRGRPIADGKEGTDLRFFHTTDLPENLVPIHRQTIDHYLHRYNGTFIVVD